MTPAMFSAESIEELRRLSPRTQSELKAWLRNKLQIMAGSNEMEANEKLPALLRGYAQQRRRVVDICLDELLSLLGEAQAREECECPDPFCGRFHGEHIDEVAAMREAERNAAKARWRKH